MLSQLEVKTFLNRIKSELINHCQFKQRLVDVFVFCTISVRPFEFNYMIIIVVID